MRFCLGFVFDVGVGPGIWFAGDAYWLGSGCGVAAAAFVLAGFLSCVEDAAVLAINPVEWVFSSGIWLGLSFA